MVESEVLIPGDTSLTNEETDAPIGIIRLQRASLENVPSLLRKIRRQLIYDVGDGFLLQPHTDVALHIDFKGRVLTLDCSDARLPVGAAWAIHAGLGAATLTHGGLPLHGAGLEWAGKAFCLMADSGVGKSTLSWYLLRHGFLFRNDDLVPAHFDPSANPVQAVTYPSASLYPKLSREAVDRYGLDAATLPVADYGTDEEEYYVPLNRQERGLSSRVLNAIFLLRPVPEGGVKVERLPTETAVAPLFANLHTVWLIGKWMDSHRLQARCSLLANLVPVFELRYTRSFAILPALERAIQETLENLP
ncbi:MAG: hypothetical protein OHK0029_30640 [Armatimonadaceae bacterium]